MEYPIGGGLIRYYRVLGLPPGADIGRVKAAYKRLAKRWHPDSCPNDRRAPARFQKVAEAYRAIVDTKERSGAELFAFLKSVAVHGHPRDIVRSYRARTISTLLLSRLALAYMEQGAFEEARDIIDRIDAAGVPLVSTFLGRAYLSFLTGDDESALENLYRAKDLFGGDMMIALNLSVLLKKVGRLADAYREIEEQADDAEHKGNFFAELAGSVSFLDDRRRVVRQLRRAVDDRRLELLSRDGAYEVTRYLTGPAPSVPGRK
jgi:tetratricopeptide (TPR) repeat protein